MNRQRARELARTKLANGERLAWSHVRRLLAADAGLRDGLLEETIANSWPSTKLGEVIQQRRGTAGPGGRRPGPDAARPGAGDAAGPAVHPYGRSKFMIEQMLADYRAIYGFGSVSLTPR